MEQGTVRTCAYCQKDKAWIWSGKRLKDGSKIYVDGESARWSGRRCPECERTRVYAAVRCDSFEKDIIVRQFQEHGFQVTSKTLPLKVEKDGRSYSVGIKRAFTQGGRIVVETPVEDGSDLVALVFESVRICSAEQLQRLGTNLGVYGAAEADAAVPTDSPAPPPPSTTDGTTEGAPAEG
jgi:hypothetical protein